jgi:hypothetical protein
MTKEAPQYWIGSASHDHVLRGVEGGFCQLSHGRPEALRRMRKGDWLAYYSGRERYGEATPCQKFTALGRIVGEEVYQVTMAEGFRPFRRDVRFQRARDADIHPLIPDLEFITNKRYWGLPFRRGYLTVSEADFRRIAEAMRGRPWR